MPRGAGKAIILCDTVTDFSAAAQIQYALERRNAPPRSITAGSAATDSTRYSHERLDQGTAFVSMEQLRQELQISTPRSSSSTAPGEEQHRGQFPLSPPHSAANSSFHHEDEIFTPSDISDNFVDDRCSPHNLHDDAGAGSDGSEGWAILYQRYHVVIAVDLGRSAFEVARNGEVFADRIPPVVALIVEAVREVVRGQHIAAGEMEEAIAAAHGAESGEGGAPLKRRVWRPKICVSLLVVNAPVESSAGSPADAAPARSTGQSSLSEEQSSSGSSCVLSDSHEKSVLSFLPIDLQFLGTADTSTRSSITPVFLRLDVCDWNELEVMSRVTERLLACERRFRAADNQSWPYGNTAHTIESLLNAIPMDVEECHSVVLVSNFAVSGCPESVALLRSIALRKSVIISVVSLNRFLAWDSPHLAPLADFLSVIGGSVFDIDTLVGLTAPTACSAWLCNLGSSVPYLGRKLFLRHIAYPPLVRTTEMRRPPGVELPLTDDSMLLVSPTFCPIRGIAAATLNEGWQVIISQNATWVSARQQYVTNRGPLELTYEVHFAEPMLYRKLFVAGAAHHMKSFAVPSSPGVGTPNPAAARPLEYGAHRQLLPRLPSGFGSSSHLRSNTSEAQQQQDGADDDADESSVMSDRAVLLPEDRTFSAVIKHTVLSQVKFSAKLYRAYGHIERFWTKVSASGPDSSLGPAWVEDAIAGARLIAHMRRQSDLWTSRFRTVQFRGWIEHRGWQKKIVALATEGYPHAPQSGHHQQQLQGETYPIFQALSSIACSSLKSSWVLFPSSRVQDEKPHRRSSGATATGLEEFPSLLFVPKKPIDSAGGHFFLQVCAHRPASTSLVMSIEVMLSCEGVAASDLAPNLLREVAEALDRKECGSFRLCLPGYKLHEDRRSLEMCTRDILCRAHFDVHPTTLADLSENSSNSSSPAVGSRQDLRLRKWQPRVEPAVYALLGGNPTQTVQWNFAMQEACDRDRYSAVLPLLVLRRIGSGFEVCHMGEFQATLRKCAGVTVTHDVIRIDRVSSRLVKVLIERFTTVLAQSSEESSFLLRSGVIHHDLRIDERLMSALHTILQLAAAVPLFGSRYQTDDDSFLRCGGTANVPTNLEAILDILQCDKAALGQPACSIKTFSSCAAHGAGMLRTRLYHIVRELGDSTVESVAQLPEGIAGRTKWRAEASDIAASVIRPKGHGGELIFLLAARDRAGINLPSPQNNSENDVFLVHGTFHITELLHGCLVKLCSLSTVAHLSADLPQPATRASKETADHVLSLIETLAGFVEARSVYMHALKALSSRAGEALWSMAQLEHLFRNMEDSTFDLDLTHILFTVAATSSTLTSSSSAKSTFFSDVFAHCEELLSRLLLRNMSAVGCVSDDTSLFVLDYLSSAFCSYDCEDCAFGDSPPTSMSSDDDEDAPSELAERGPTESTVTYPLLARFMMRLTRANDSGPALATWLQKGGMLSPVTSLEELPDDGGALAWNNEVDVSECRLTLRIVLRSIPQHQQRLCANVFFPTRHDLHSVYVPSGSASAPQSLRSIFFSNDASLLDLPSTAPSTQSIPEFFEEIANRLVSILAEHAVGFSLQRALRCNAARAVYNLCRNEGNPLNVCASPVTSQEDSRTLRIAFGHVPTIPSSALQAFRSLWIQAIAPAVRSCRSLLQLSFPVQFSLAVLSKHFADVTAILAANMCDDGFLAIPISEMCIAVIPSDTTLSKTVVLLQLCPNDNQPNLIEMAECWLWAPHSITREETAQQIQREVAEKVLQISQQVLFQQMRSTGYAPVELIAEKWGQQFLSPVQMQVKAVSTQPVSSGAAADISSKSLQRLGASGAFCCEGRTVLAVPIHPTQRSQARKILRRLRDNHLDLLMTMIFEREQCFMVPDDDAEGALHYVRIVFVPEGMSVDEISTNSPSPPLPSEKKAHFVAVQLFSSTPTRAKVNLVLTRIQHFLYNFAVSELLHNFSYVGVSTISPQDLRFIQDHSLGAFDFSALPLSNAAVSSLQTNEETFQQTVPSQSSSANLAQLARQETTSDDLDFDTLLRIRKSDSLMSLSSGEACWESVAAHAAQHAPEAARHVAEMFLRHNLTHRGFKELHLDSPPLGEAFHEQFSGSSSRASEHSTSCASQPSPSDPFYSWVVPQAKNAASSLMRRQCTYSDVLQKQGLTVKPNKTLLYIKTSQEDQPNGIVSCTVEMFDSGVTVLCIYRTCRITRGNKYVQEAIEALEACVDQVNVELEVSHHIFGHLADALPSPRSSVAGAIPGRLLRMGTVQKFLSRLLDRIVGAPSSPILNRVQIPTEGICSSMLPAVLQNITGVLESMQPALIHVPAARTGRKPSVWRGFPWSNLEEAQGVPLDPSEYFIVCGFLFDQSVEEGKAVGSTEALQYVTRVQRVTHPSAGFSPAPLLPAVASQLKPANPVVLDLSRQVRIVVRVAPEESVIEAMFFNLRDSNELTFLLRDVANSAAAKTDILRSILLQGLGFSVPHCISERHLAECCCGDISAVTDRQMDISQESFTRNVLPLRCPVGSTGLLNTIVHGLHNRALVVNYIFPSDGAIKILFDEVPQLSYSECVESFHQLVEQGHFVKLLEAPRGLYNRHGKGTHHAHGTGHCDLYRLAGDSATVPPDVLVASNYHRHLQVAHILLERKNARSRVTELMVKFKTAWLRRREHSRELLPLVIELQSMCKQVYGSRVPEFSLRDASAKPADQILSQTFPQMHRQGRELCRSVDRVLAFFMQHLRRRFRGLFVLDVDPMDETNLLHELVLSRLQCRYGKVVTRDRTIEFSPHLYFVVVPISDIRERSEDDVDETPETAPADSKSWESIVDGGLFILEVGFQVVNYALDFFILNGSVLSAAEISSKTRLFKQELTFSSVLYDICVSRLLVCLTCHSATLPGEQPLGVALENLIRFYPLPPNFSYCCVSRYEIEDKQILDMRKKREPKQVFSPLRQTSQTTLSTSTSNLMLDQADDDEPLVTFVVPDNGEDDDGIALVRSKTGDHYQYAGLTVWAEEKVFMFVVIAPRQPPENLDKSLRFNSTDLHVLAGIAFTALITQLLDRNLRERTEAAWNRLWQRGETDIKSEEFELASRFCSRLELADPLKRLQLGHASQLGFQWLDALKRMQGRSRRLHDVVVNFVEAPPQAASSTKRVLVVTLPTHSGVFTYVAIDTRLNTVVEFALCRSVAGPSVSSVGLVSEEEGVVVEAALRFIVSAMWNTIAV
jgi:hypothetical protein